MRLRPVSQLSEALDRTEFSLRGELHHLQTQHAEARKTVAARHAKEEMVLLQAAPSTPSQNTVAQMVSEDHDSDDELPLAKRLAAAAPTPAALESTLRSLLQKRGREKSC